MHSFILLLDNHGSIHNKLENAILVCEDNKMFTNLRATSVYPKLIFFLFYFLVHFVCHETFDY